MSDIARLLQQYGYGEQPNALAQDGVSYDTSNVLAGMPKPNALASALPLERLRRAMLKSAAT